MIRPRRGKPLFSEETQYSSHVLFFANYAHSNYAFM